MRNWYWFKTYQDGIDVGLEHYYTTHDRLAKIANEIVEKSRRFNHTSDITIEVYSDDADLELVYTHSAERW